MKKKWWIVLIVVILLIVWWWIAWYLVYENNLPGCEKEYRECMERQYAWYPEICFPCEIIEDSKQYKNKSWCDEEKDDCAHLIIKWESGENVKIEEDESKCENKYRACLERQKRWYDEICFPCWGDIGRMK